MFMKNGKNRAKIEEKQGIIVKIKKIWSKTIEQPEKASLETFSMAFYCKYAEILIYLLSKEPK